MNAKILRAIGLTVLIFIVLVSFASARQLTSRPVIVSDQVIVPEIPELEPYMNCSSNKDCSDPYSEQFDNKFCKFSGCEADFGVCTQIPEGCPDVYEPVCGCDGVTYSSECELDLKQVRKAHDGRCEPVVQECKSDFDCYIDGINKKMFCEFDGCYSGLYEDIGITGKCVEVPEICPSLYNPVCGCDGNTYANDCVLKSNRVSKDHDGICESEETCFSDRDCFRNEFCEFDGCLAETGKCTKLPEVCPFYLTPENPLVADPVCGCDGKTYPNECVANQNRVSVDYEGECQTPFCEDGRTRVQVYREDYPEEENNFCIRDNIVSRVIRLLMNWSR